VGIWTTQTTPKVTEVPCWYAIHTRHQHETAVQRQLEREGIHSYLPLMDEVRQWSDRKKRIQVPLFSCFVFVRGIYSPQMHHAVVQKPGVLGFVGIGKQGEPIPDSEIDSIRQLLASRIPFSPYPFLNTGQRVRIRGGSLDNVEGVVVSNTGRKLIVSVETIHRSIAVQLEDGGYRIEVLPLDPLRALSRAVGMGP
jgi:transcription antitermination factor NusG